MATNQSTQEFGKVKVAIYTRDQDLVEILKKNYRANSKFYDEPGLFEPEYSILAVYPKGRTTPPSILLKDQRSIVQSNGSLTSDSTLYFSGNFKRKDFEFPEKGPVIVCHGKLKDASESKIGPYNDDISHIPQELLEINKKDLESKLSEYYITVSACIGPSSYGLQGFTGPLSLYTEDGSSHILATMPKETYELLSKNKFSRLNDMLKAVLPEKIVSYLKETFIRGISTTMDDVGDLKFADDPDKKTIFTAPRLIVRFTKFEKLPKEQFIPPVYKYWVGRLWINQKINRQQKPVGQKAYRVLGLNEEEYGTKVGDITKYYALDKKSKKKRLWHINQIIFVNKGEIDDEVQRRKCIDDFFEKTPDEMLQNLKKERHEYKRVGISPLKIMYSKSH